MAVTVDFVLSLLGLSVVVAKTYLLTAFVVKLRFVVQPVVVVQTYFEAFSAVIP